MSKQVIAELKKCLFERDRIEFSNSVYCNTLDQYVAANFCAFMCQKRKEVKA